MHHLLSTDNMAAMVDDSRTGVKYVIPKGMMEGVVLMGFDRDGELFFSSTYADGGTVLWLMEQCKKRLLEAQE